MNQGIMLNIDGTHFTYSRHLKGIAPTEKEIRGMVTKYEGTKVTDLVFCSNERLACYPSKVTTDVVDKVLQKNENGQSVDYSNTYFKLAYEM